MKIRLRDLETTNFDGATKLRTDGISKNKGKITEMKGEIEILKKEKNEITNRVQLPKPIRIGKKLETRISRSFLE